MSIRSDVQKLAPGQIIELFELDARPIGGDLLCWHAGVNGLGNNITWAGNVYSRYPVEATGFAKTTKGTIPRPNIKVANISGLVSLLCKEHDDLVGMKVLRKRTFARYLDGVNFPGGVNPTADPLAAFPDELWEVSQKTGEDDIYVSFELSAAFDVEGVLLPSRLYLSNSCQWGYGSAECGYSNTTSGPKATDTDMATTVLALDSCSKTLTGCKFRFGSVGQLPFGGFPGVGLVK
jgi:lambda family phage minor tail protein L